MKLSKEIKRWINRRRKASGKPNGVVKWLWDDPEKERMLGTNKKNRA